MPAAGAIDTLLLDLDGTLYPITKENDFEQHVRQRVFRFMTERLGIPVAEAPAIWRRGFVQYNQSLKGLKAQGLQFSNDEFWDFIRSGAEHFLRPDPAVRECLLSLPQRKWLFTNANERSARHCLQLLDLEGIVEGIVGADAMGDTCKPLPDAFAKALELSGADPARTAMFEDSLKNLRTAKALGMTTVLISGETAVEEAVTSEDLAATVDAVIAALTTAELRRVLPQLWPAAT